MTKSTEQSEHDAGDESDGRTWVASGFTARVIKNEDDDGWAVTMTRDGDAEPVLTSPWTMGRDKKNPKPLNHTDFKTLLKGALDVVSRHEAHARALRHRSVTVADGEGRPVRVDLDVAADEDDPHAILSAWDAAGDKLAERRVAPNFKLSGQSASRWVAGEFGEV
jgi:hypothetical protein